MRPINCGNKTAFVVVGNGIDEHHFEYEKPPVTRYSALRLDAGSKKSSQKFNRPSSAEGEAAELNTLIRSNNIMRQPCQGLLQNRSLIVDMLAIGFGIGTWLCVNSTFIQLPLLVKEAPEGWNLPSYLSVCVQIGNIGPLTYTLMQKLTKNKKNDGNIIYGILFIGTVSPLLIAFFYGKTAVIFGDEHSVALFILTIFSAINACTSNVLFMPYMGRFREIYMVTFFVGEGLSGFLPSVVALIQGIGGNTECILKNVTETGEEIYESYTPPPRFGTKEFFIFVFTLMVCSFICFTLLDRLKLSHKQYAQVEIKNGNKYVYKRETELNKESNGNNKETLQTDKDLTDEISSARYGCLLALIGVVSFFSNGIFNSILSFSCLPYGEYAYHLSATLSVMANPIACFLAVFLPHTSVMTISTLSGLGSVLIAYLLLTATMSPTPPLHGTTTGAVIVIIAWTLLIGLVSYIKICIITVMRSQGGKSLVWAGGLTQLGSLLGSLLIFALINYTKIFEAASETC